MCARDTNWTVTGAKARFAEVIERAQSMPQTITRNGKPIVVVVSGEEWQRKTVRKGTLAEFLLDSPLRGAGLHLRARDKRLRIDYMSLMINLSATYWYFSSSLAAGGLRSI